MNRLLVVFFAIFSCLAVKAASADALLNKAADRLRGCKSVTADYTVTADGRSMNGTITVAGDKFVIDSRDLKAWYDGKTQWTYSAEIDEVNVVEPTEEELAQVNPFAIISAFRSLYTQRLLSTTGGMSTIELLPKEKGRDVKKIIITLSDSTFFPSKVVIYMVSGSVLAITVKSVSEGMALPDSHFRFTPARMPGVEVIDLR